MAAVMIAGERHEYPEGTPYRVIAEDFQEKEQEDILLVRADGKLRELHKELSGDCSLSFITAEDREGWQTYQRSAVFLMLKAFYDAAGRDCVKKVTVCFSVGQGLYIEPEGDFELNEELLKAVKDRMEELREARLPIVKKSLNTQEAVEHFHRHGMYDKEKLFRFRRASRVNVYSIDKFEDYFYGYMVPDTGYIKYFDLTLYEKGFVLLLPKRSAPRKIEPLAPRKKLFTVQRQSESWGEKLGIFDVGSLNEAITQGRMNEIILMQEALQEKQIGDIAEQIAARPDRKLVMIAGPSSSGKTTFSHRLSVQLRAHGLKPHPIPVDDYFVDRERTPLDEFGKPNFECLGALDVDLFNEHMSALLRGERVELPNFNFITGKREYKGNYKQIGRDDILVIEGIHGLNDQLSYSIHKDMKFKIYISALTQLNVDEHNRIPTTDGRLIRRIVRDAAKRGASCSHTIAMWDSVRRGEEENIFPFQEEADAMFNSALIYELAVLKQYAQPQLFSIGRDAPEYDEAKRLLKFLDYFLGVSSENVPNNSILREFIGNGCFKV